jgi:exo-beta-1,3-glucanase (GH17 family)
MSRCVSPVPSRRCDRVWIPCSREARRGDHFCATHRDALDGAFMGYYSMNESSDTHKNKKRPAARVHRVSSASGYESGAPVIGGGFPSRGTSNGEETPQPETHVFSDHQDLVSFRRDELAKNADK